MTSVRKPFPPTDGAADAIRAATQLSVDTVLKIGKILFDARIKLRGRFEEWLSAETPYSLSTAERFIRVYKAFRFVKIENITLDALYHLASPTVPSEAVEYAAELSRRSRVTLAEAREIITAHRLPPALVSRSAEILRVPESRLTLQADRDLNSALAEGGSVYLTRVESEDGDYCRGTLIDRNGKAKSAIGECASHAIIGLTGNFPVKTCSTCGTEKTITEFGRSNTSPDGYEHRCRSCIAKKDRIRNRRRLANGAARRVVSK